MLDDSADPYSTSLRTGDVEESRWRQRIFGREVNGRIAAGAVVGAVRPSSTGHHLAGEK